MGAYRMVALGRQHDRESFTCGVDSLDKYLKQQARKDVERRSSACFVMCSNNAPQKVIGYYTLSAYTVELSDLPDTTQKKLPRYPQVPCTLLGRLARDKRHAGTGSLLLVDALKRSLLHASEIASFAVVVHALSEEATAFYEHFGFIRLDETGHQLFLPMVTIEQL